MRRLLLSVSIIVCISGWAYADAVKPEAGVPYAGGTLIRFPDPTFLFTIPEGYAGFLSPGEDVRDTVNSRQSISRLLHGRIR